MELKWFSLSYNEWWLFILKEIEERKNGNLLKIGDDWVQLSFKFNTIHLRN